MKTTILSIKAASLFLLACLSSAHVFSQSDSLISDSSRYTTDPIIVTDTKKESHLSSSTLPVTVIGKEDIFRQSAVRLSDILSEQVGLFIMQDHGSGVQMQGMDPDYVLILIDGEPVTGKQAGAIDLSRFSVGNIQQIEIVKGPSSSLYGSDALAGVINIITKKPGLNTGFQLNAKYGTYNSTDFNGSFEHKREKFGFYLFADRTGSSGYDLTPSSISKTAPEYYTYTASPKVTLKLGTSADLTAEGRFYTEVIKNIYEIRSSSEVYLINERSTVKDFSAGIKLAKRFSRKIDLTSSFYFAGYVNNDNNVYDADGSEYSDITFRQFYNKAEFLSHFNIFKNNTQTLGTGLINESVKADYIKDGSKSANTFYAFFQNEFSPSTKLSLVAGARFDSGKDYESRFSPKLSIMYKLFDWMKVKASAGSGYKAPSFQQLYLDWNNPIAGYSVYGVANFKEGFRRLLETGQIAEILIDPSGVGTIQPEISNAYNAALELNPASWGSIKVNFFRNDIKNLIDVVQVARKTNGQSVFTYFNLNKVYTQGFESELNIRFPKGISFSAGYQYLEAYDKEVLELIRKGLILKVGATGVIRPVQEVEYGGLYGRSKHSGVFKVSYQNDNLGLGLNLRAVVRSRYGYADLNSNGILDNDNEYIPGYAMFNTSFTKNIGNMVTVQAGIDNILNKTDAKLMPEFPGRIFFAGIRLNYTKQ